MSAAAEGDAPQTQDPVEILRERKYMERDESCRLMKLADFNGEEGTWNGKECFVTVNEMSIRISAISDINFPGVPDPHRIEIFGMIYGQVYFRNHILPCRDQTEIFMHNIKFIKKTYLRMSRVKAARAPGDKRAREA